jgi:hypothetical protein
VIAFLTGCVPLTNAVTQIAVTGPRTQTAGGPVPATLRISVTLADIVGRAVAGPMNALLNVRWAVYRVVDNPMEFATSEPGLDRTPGILRQIAAAAENRGIP